MRPLDVSRRLQQAFSRHPASIALEFAPSECITYGQLHALTSRLQQALATMRNGNGSATLAVLADRSLTAYSAMLAALRQGVAFMPLNPRHPPAVLGRMLRLSECALLAADAGSVPMLDALIEESPALRVVFLPGTQQVPESLLTRANRAGIRSFGADDLDDCSTSVMPDIAPDAPAIVMFTSGSTGTPKGVIIPWRALDRFVDTMIDRYAVDCDDRSSNITPLSFDCALIETLLPLLQGARVCIPSAHERMNLGSYIVNRGLTHWVASPSTAALMRTLGAVSPGAFPSIRVSIFGSEGLPVDLAAAWARAAPNSIVDNVYGPTELTVCCTTYRFDDAKTPAIAENGLVPIGAPHPAMRALVVDEDLRPVACGQSGELLMTGEQLATGYLGDAGIEQAAFVVPPGETGRFYRTRDLVRQPFAGDPLKYLGRMDHQFKVNGVRVEPAEIEAALRDATGIDNVLACGWPLVNGNARGVVAFMETVAVDTRQVLTRLRAGLPHYMVPNRIVCLEAFPRLPNGKVDRNALLTRHL